MEFQLLIKKINAFAKLSKERELTYEELHERHKLRMEYLSAWRKSLESKLEHITVIDKNGNKIKIPSKKKT
ncbi:DUF896 domain-containing protein [Spiroplasma endosymbiont of Labia minor]|uniref:DUF896 domain-containing protein n=1 Tax=Spiroplasma endosymbiont of Labia minor TaxID=3066305 RepID=UPI0030CC1D4F